MPQVLVAIRVLGPFSPICMYTGIPKEIDPTQFAEKNVRSRNRSSSFLCERDTLQHS